MHSSTEKQRQRAWTFGAIPGNRGKKQLQGELLTTTDTVVSLLSLSRVSLEFQASLSRVSSKSLSSFKQVSLESFASLSQVCSRVSLVSSKSRVSSKSLSCLASLSRQTSNSLSSLYSVFFRWAEHPYER